jgi:hypothetical protein
VIFRLNNVPDAKFWAERAFFDQYDPLHKKYSRMDRRFAPEERSRVKKTYTKGGANSSATTATSSKAVGVHEDEIESEGGGEAKINIITSVDGTGDGESKGSFGTKGLNIGVGTSEFDGEESPIVTHQEVESESGGGMSSKNTFNTSATAYADGDVKSRTWQRAKTRGVNVAMQQGTATTYSSSSNWSESESIEHYIAYVEYFEEVDVQHYSEAEQISMGAQVIIKLANRHCLIKFPGKPAVLCKTADMFDAPLSEAELEQKMLPVYAQPWYAKVEDVEREIQIRQAPFQAKSKGRKKGQQPI